MRDSDDSSRGMPEDLPPLPDDVHDRLQQILFGDPAVRDQRLAELARHHRVDPDAIAAHARRHAALGQKLAQTSESEPGTQSGNASGAGRPLERGCRFGHYRILEPLAVGGMGAVYLAESERLGRRVALKTVRPDRVADPLARERFRRESRALAALRHPSICTVYEADEVDGIPFLAMELIAGQSLADQIRQRRARVEDGGEPLTSTELPRLLRAFELAAEALHVAHAAGLVHRDIKPGNVLMDDTGTPVLIDFGLAKTSTGPDTDPTLTGHHELLGTPPYMSPEQLDPRREVDYRTDIYSLAVSLFECLTLERPFEADDRLELYRRIENEPTPNPCALERRLPTDLGPVLVRAMEKDPAHRYRSALEFADELRRVRNRQPVRARRVGAVGRTLRWVRRNPIPTGVGIVLLAATLTIGALLRETSQRSAELAVASKEAAATALLRGADFEREERPYLSLALALWVHDLLPSHAALDQIRRSLASCGSVAQLRGHEHYVQCSALASDGSFACTGSYDGTVRIYDRQGASLHRFDVGGQVVDLQLVDDAELLVTTMDRSTSPPLGTVWRCDATTGSMTRLLEIGDTCLGITGAAGRRLAVAAGSELLVLDDHEVVRRYPFGRRTWQVESSPTDPHVVAASCYGNLVRIYDTRAETDHPLAQVETEAPVDTLCWSPDGRDLLVFDNRGHMWMVGFRGARPDVRRLPRAHGVRSNSRGRTAAWRADGAAFLTVADDGLGFVWDREGRLQTVLRGHTGAVHCCAALVGDDGWVTAGQDGTVRTWSASGHPYRVLREHRSSISGGLHLDDSGQLLLSAGQDGKAVLWDLTLGHARVHSSQHGGVFWTDFVPGSEDRQLVAATEFGHLSVIDQDHGKLQDIELPAPNITGSCAFLPDGRLVAAQFGGSLAVVNLTTGLVEASWKSDSHKGITLVHVLRDGRVLILQHAWDALPPKLLITNDALETPEVVAELRHPLLSSDLATDPDEAVAFIPCADGVLRAVDLDTGGIQALLRETGNGIGAVAVSPDGRWLATGGVERVVRIYRLDTDPRSPLGPPRELLGHESEVIRLRFGPDSERLSSVSSDATARLWDVEGASLSVLRDYRGPVYDARWSRDGTLVATACADHTLRLRFADPAALLAAARSQRRELDEELYRPYQELLDVLQR